SDDSPGAHQPDDNARKPALQHGFILRYAVSEIGVKQRGCGSEPLSKGWTGCSDVAEDEVIGRWRAPRVGIEGAIEGDDAPVRQEFAKMVVCPTIPEPELDDGSRQLITGGLELRCCPLQEGLLGLKACDEGVEPAHSASVRDSSCRVLSWGSSGSENAYALMGVSCPRMGTSRTVDPGKVMREAWSAGSETSMSASSSFVAASSLLAMLTVSPRAVIV